MKQALPAFGERVTAVTLATSEDDRNFIQGLPANENINWPVAIAPKTLQQALIQKFGPAALNHASAPVYIYDREGKVHATPVGVKNGDALAAEIKKYLN